ncbi:MAG: DUF4097 family beta strand repeat protein [Clostridia bacterium]|nr:DUF4097 family beta strand repeat protein [Clostridia bacterium]
MSKSMIMKLGAAVCVIALCVCCVSIGGHAFLGGFRYADAGKYTAGAAVIDGDVKKLDIHWTDGAVEFVERAGDGIELTETAQKPISGNAQLRWWLDGDTLRVQYAKNGFFSLTSLNKTLTVALPEGMALEDVRVDATSADVKAPGLTADAVAVGLTSGDLELELTGPADSVALSGTSGDLHATLQSAKTVSAGTTSGAIDLALAGASDGVALSSTSGDIRAELGDVKALTAGSTSGAIRVTAGAAGQAALDSTSGDITAQFAAFDELKISATSGGVTAILPEEPGFTAHVDTTSGDFDSVIPLKRDGDTYACGDERAQLKIDTTSGDVRLEALKAD